MPSFSVGRSGYRSSLPSQLDMSAAQNLTSASGQCAPAPILLPPVAPPPSFGRYCELMCDVLSLNCMYTECELGPPIELGVFEALCAPALSPQPGGVQMVVSHSLVGLSTIGSIPAYPSSHLHC